MSDKPTKPLTTRQRAPSVVIAFRTLARTLRHGYENLGTLGIGGLLWLLSFMLCLPLTILLVLLAESIIGQRHYELLLLPLGPPTAALHRLAQPMTEERSANWRSFFTYLRADLLWSSKLQATLVLGLLMIQINIGFYGASASSALQFIAILFVTVLIIWLGIALYAFPLALRQEEQGLRATLRNALVMVLANAPGLLISLTLLALLAATLLILPPLFVLVPAVMALWGQENARLLLVASGYIAKDEIADRDPADRHRSRR